MMNDSKQATMDEALKQLADIWHVPAEVFSSSLELAQQVLADRPPIADRQLVSDTIRDSLAFEDGMPRGHLLVQIANRATHLLSQRGVLVTRS